MEARHRGGAAIRQRRVRAERVEQTRVGAAQRAASRLTTSTCANHMSVVTDRQLRIRSAPAARDSSRCPRRRTCRPDTTPLQSTDRGAARDRSTPLAPACRSDRDSPPALRSCISDLRYSAAAVVVAAEILADTPSLRSHVVTVGERARQFVGQRLCFIRPDARAAGAPPRAAYRCRRGALCSTNAVHEVERLATLAALLQHAGQRKRASGSSGCSASSFSSVARAPAELPCARCRSATFERVARIALALFVDVPREPPPRAGSRRRRSRRPSGAAQAHRLVLQPRDAARRSTRRRCADRAATRRVRRRGCAEPSRSP